MIQVNGVDYSGTEIRGISGFVFQDDVLLPTMTVKEAVSMSAILRLPREVDKEERGRRVDDAIRLFHLANAANTKIGSATSKGVSGGERKRTCRYCA